MMCYKDRTWCNQICDNTTCDRNVTEDVIKAATLWWGGEDFPLATTCMKTDDCGYKWVDAPYKLKGLADE